MGLVVGFLVVGLVVVVAAALVVREAGRLRADPPPAVFDVDEAYEWVVEELPDEVAATLTSEDVRRIIDFQVEYLDQSGVAGNGSAPGSVAPAIVGAAEVVDYILERAETTGEAYIPEQVYPVVEILLEYLSATGAVSTRADPDAPLAP